MRNDFIRPFKTVFNLLLIPLLCLTASCTYKDRVAPIHLPDAVDGVEVGQGLKISAIAFVDDRKAEAAIGFKVRKAGLLPVQVTFQNDSPDRVSVVPDQTFLVDTMNNAWQITSLERTYQRTKGHVEVGETLAGAAKPAVLLGVAGAVAGLAVGIVSGDDIGKAIGKGAVLGGALGAGLGGASRYESAKKEIRDDLADKRLSNRDILPGQIAYGILFFPGAPEEAKGAKELRLYLKIGDVGQVVRLPL